MVFEEGKSMGVMGSYNRLGLMETAASYPLMTEVLRGEWGFKGAVLSDMTHSGNGNIDNTCYENVAWRVIAGCNNQLDSNGFGGQIASQYAKWDNNANGGKGAPVCNNSTQIAWSLWNACREAVKQHMFMCLNSTSMQRGMTQVVGETKAAIAADESFSYDVASLAEAAGVTEGENVNVYNSSNEKSSKEIASIDGFEINERCDLPEGVSFDKDSGVLSGKLPFAGTFYIDVIINLTFDDESTGAVAYKFILDGACHGEESGTTPEKEPEEKKGCFGSITVTSAFIAGLAIAGAALVASKRKED